MPVKAVTFDAGRGDKGPRAENVQVGPDFTADAANRGVYAALTRTLGDLLPGRAEPAGRSA